MSEINLNQIMNNNGVSEVSGVTESLISQLLMGFVERRVSPQTIADVVRARIAESHMTPDEISPATCNGIIEVVTGTTNGAWLDILLFFSRRKDFPNFMSQKSASGMLVHALKSIPEIFGLPDGRERLALLSIIDQVCRKLLTFATLGTIPGVEKNRLLSAIKSVSESGARALLASSSSLSILKAKLLVPTQDNIKSATAYTPAAEIFRQMMSNPDHILAQKGIGFFKIHYSDNNGFWKLRNIDTLINFLNTPGIEAFKAAFACEWFFIDGLYDTSDNERNASYFDAALRRVIEEQGANITVLKGVVRALQHDLSRCVSESGGRPMDNVRFTEMMQRAEMLFLWLLPHAEQDSGVVLKQFFAWALQLPVHPHESRLVTRNQFMWQRALATGSWDEGLRDAPVWIISSANRFCAKIFQIAPSFWLQEYSWHIIDRLFVEANTEGFVADESHSEYVEFLVRTLRRKSPFFATRNDLLFALKQTAKASASEESQMQLLETRFRMNPTSVASKPTDVAFWQCLVGSREKPELLGHNPVSRALNIVAHTAREGAKSTATWKATKT